MSGCRFQQGDAVQRLKATGAPGFMTGTVLSVHPKRLPTGGSAFRVKVAWASGATASHEETQLVFASL